MSSEVPDLNQQPMEEQASILDLNLQPDYNSGDDQPTNINNEPIQILIRRELTDAKRRSVYERLLEKSVEGQLIKNTTTEVAYKFNCSIRTVQRIWKRGRDSETNDYMKRRAKNCGRKMTEIDLQKFREIPFRKRASIRSLAHALAMSKSFIHDRLKGGEIKYHSNAIHPSLNQNKIYKRLEFCLEMIDSTTVPHNPTFLLMDNTIHIDEKWFNMTKKIENYYMLSDEDDPVHNIRSTNFIPKIMFLGVVARPRYDILGNCTFDGQIGVFPLISHVPTIRSSRNRDASTLEIKAINKVNRDIVGEFMIEYQLSKISGLEIAL